MLCCAASEGTIISNRWRYFLLIQGREVEIADGEISVGRSQSANISVKDASVSRNHAVIQAREGRLTVKDLNSSNGTFVNGMRVFAESELHDGDRLTLGESESKVRIVAPESIAATMRIDPRAWLAGEELRLQAEEEAQAAVAAAQAAPAVPAVEDLAGFEVTLKPIASSRLPVPAPAPVPPAPVVPMAPIAPPPAAPVAVAPIPAAPLPSAPVLESPSPAMPAISVATPMAAAVVVPAPVALPMSAAPAPVAEAPGGAEASADLLGALPPLPPVDPLPSRSPDETPRAEEFGLPDLDLPPLPPVDTTPRPASAVRTTSPRASVLSPARGPQQFDPAGFWIRTVAALVDGLWVLVVCGLAWFATGSVLDDEQRMTMVTVLSSFLWLASSVVGWSLWGATPGKLLLGLRVFPAGGNSPGVGFPKGLLRALGYMLSSLTAGVGFLMAAFTKDKRALHDMIAGTLVGRLKKPAA